MDGSPGSAGARTAPGPEPKDALLVVSDLTVSFESRGRTGTAVRGLSLEVAAGEKVALVGESGSGKSVSALALLSLLEGDAVRVRAREATLLGRALLGASRADLREIRGRDVGMVFQEPMSALDPLQTIGDQIVEGLGARGVSRSERRKRARDLLAAVGIPDPDSAARRFPHEFSGGMRQRAVIATAIAQDPKLLIADEPTTALDVTIQSQILDLFDRLVADRGMGLLLITHDLAVAAERTDRAVVLYGGVVMETGPTRALFAAPRHPYTAGLVRALPRGPGIPLEPIRGNIPSVFMTSPGCRFAPRCGRAVNACHTNPEIPLVTGADGRGIRCLNPIPERAA